VKSEDVQVVGRLWRIKLLVNILVLELAILELEEGETDGGFKEDEHVVVRRGRRGKREGG
jgi:hypothetical protein